MNSFELNKVAGAALGALLLAVGSGFVAELIYHPKPAGQAGYPLPEPEPETAAATAEAPKVEPIAVRLASANVERGQGGTKACQACHSFEKGGPNKVGPHLYDVVEREKAHSAGFDYSAALKEKGGTWTYADLDHFLENPKGYAKGTKMAFAGIASPQERGNVIAYLRTLSESPKPLPAVEKAGEAPAATPAAAKPADAKPADAKPADAKPAAEKPADGKPVDQAAGDKPTASKPAQNKASEGKDSPAKPADINAGDTKPAAEKAPGSPAAPTSQINRNSPEPKATIASEPVASAPPITPSTPAAPATTEAPAKADPEAVDKAKSLEINKDTEVRDGAKTE